MKVQYVVSATVVIEHNGVKVLCDPWLTNDGVFYGAWHHNPPVEATPEDFHDCQFCYISHIHQDHCDLETLKRLNKNTTVLLAPYADEFLRTMIAGRGFPVRVLQHREVVALGPDFTIEIVPADNCDPEACGRHIGCPLPGAVKQGMTYQIDSVAVFKGGDRVVVNVNDCPFPLARPALEEIRQRYGPADLAMVSYASAGPWPHCFPQLGPEDMVAEALKKRDKVLAWTRQTVETLGARAWMPFAGQYTLGGKLWVLNDLRGLPEMEDLPWSLGAPTVKMARGQWLEFNVVYDLNPSLWGEFKDRDMMAVRGYTASTLAQKKLPYADDPWPVNVPDLFDEAEIAWRARTRARGIGAEWDCQLAHRKDGVWSVMLFREGEDEWVRVDVDARLLVRLLKRKAHWNAAEIGCHLTYYREPLHHYNRVPYMLLNYLHV